MDPSSPAPFFLFIGCSAILEALLIPVLVFIRRNPSTEAQKELAWFLAATAGYLLCNSLEISAPSESITLFFASACYAFIGGIPTAFFLFSLRFSGHQKLATKLRKLRWIIPLFELFVVCTNEAHHLHWVSYSFFHIGPFISMRGMRYGPLFWVMWTYHQFFAISGVILLFSSVFERSRSLNRQTSFILFGSLIPMIFNAVYVFHVIPGLRKDFTPISYALAGLVFFLGTYYNRLFDLVPIARRALVEALADPLIAVDSQGPGRIVDANPAACRVCKLPADPRGRQVRESPFLSSIVERARMPEKSVLEAKADDERWYEVRVVDVPAGGRTLRLYAMRDVTERRQLIEEKTALVEKLSRALADVRTLEGIIPICASCKKVRDDSGYWQQVENYVSSRTMAEFSHGLCPECRERLYADLKLPDSGSAAPAETR